MAQMSVATKRVPVIALSATESIKRHAIGQQVVDARPGFARHAKRHRLVNNSGSSQDRIAAMFFRRIAIRERRRDAALRPH